MKHTVLILILSLVLLSCTKEENPVSNQQQPEPTIGIVFGQERDVNGIWSNVIFQRQDTVSHSEFDSVLHPVLVQNIVFRIAETEVHQKSETFDHSSIHVTCSTIADSESFQAENGCRIRGYGSATSGSTINFSFELLVPTILTSRPTHANGVLELKNDQNDQIVVTYKSPWSQITVRDTLNISR